MDAPRYERYSSVPLFEGLQPEEIGALLGFSQEVIVEPGDVVISEGDIPGHFFIIAEGSLDVIKSDGANPKVLARLSDLSSFGEMGLVSENRHTASVVAVTRSRLRSFSIAKFKELLEMQDRTVYRTVYRMVLGLARLIAMRLQSSDHRRVN